MVWPLALKKPGLWDHGIAFDVRVQNVLEKTLAWQTVVWPLGLKNPGLTDQGVATVVTKFRMASGGLSLVPTLNIYFNTNTIDIDTKFSRNLKNTSKKKFQLALLKMTTFCLHPASQTFKPAIHYAWCAQIMHEKIKN